MGGKEVSSCTEPRILVSGHTHRITPSRGPTTSLPEKSPTRPSIPRQSMSAAGRPGCIRGQQAWGREPGAVTVATQQAREAALRREEKASPRGQRPRKSSVFPPPACHPAESPQASRALGSRQEARCPPAVAPGSRKRPAACPWWWTTPTTHEAAPQPPAPLPTASPRHFVIQSETDLQGVRGEGRVHRLSPPRLTRTHSPERWAAGGHAAAQVAAVLFPGICLTQGHTCFYPSSLGICFTRHPDVRASGDDAHELDRHPGWTPPSRAPHPVPREETPGTGRLPAAHMSAWPHRISSRLPSPQFCVSSPEPTSHRQKHRDDVR